VSACSLSYDSIIFLGPLRPCEIRGNACFVDSLSNNNEVVVMFFISSYFAKQLDHYMVLFLYAIY